MGPGLGQHGYVSAFLRALLPAISPEELRAIVIDADALNNIAKVERWWEMLKRSRRHHAAPGRAVAPVGPIGRGDTADRLAAARRCAAEWGRDGGPQGREHCRRRAGRPRAAEPFRQPWPGDRRHRRRPRGGDHRPHRAGGGAVRSRRRSACTFMASRRSWCGGTSGTPGMLAGDVAAALPRAIKELRGE